MKFQPVFVYSTRTNIPPIDNPAPPKHSTPKNSKTSNQPAFDPLFNSMSKFDAAITNFHDASTAFIKTKQEENLDETALVGALMELKLNEMSP